MGIDSILHSYDNSKIKVIAGDIAEGYWELSGSSMRHYAESGRTAAERVDLADAIKSIDLKDQLNKDANTPLLGAGVGALLGLRFGIPGALAGGFVGHMLAQNKPQVSIRCELTDGRKFIAVMSPEMYKQFKSLQSTAYAGT